MTQQPELSKLSPRGGYPLAALFVLVTIAAVLTAAIAPLARQVQRGELEWTTPVLAAGIGALALGVICLVLGGAIFGWVRGMLLGGLAGAVVGTVAGPLALVNSRDLLPVTVAMIAGSLLAVILALGMRRKDEL